MTRQALLVAARFLPRPRACARSGRARRDADLRAADVGRRGRRARDGRPAAGGAAGGSAGSPWPLASSASCPARPSAVPRSRPGAARALRAGDRADALVDAVERVLDALEPLRDGAHRRVRRSRSPADGRLRAPIATSCACAAFSRASNARESALLTNGLSSSSWASLPRASSLCREMRARSPSAASVVIVPPHGVGVGKARRTIAQGLTADPQHACAATLDRPSRLLQEQRTLHGRFKTGGLPS